MRVLRKADQRGHADHGWLKARHTFSFADYHDPQWMGFRSLRVLNDDTVDPGAGFGRHPHRDMEILTYILSGSLEHQDSMGNRRVIQTGEMQYMAAGIPCVASALSGTVEMLGEHGSGLYAAELSSWTKHLLALAGDPALCRRMGMAGRERFESQFTAEAAARRWAKIFRRTAAARS